MRTNITTRLSSTIQMSTGVKTLMMTSNSHGIFKAVRFRKKVHKKDLSPPQVLHDTKTSALPLPSINAVFNIFNIFQYWLLLNVKS